jgi:spore germination protein KA
MDKLNPFDTHYAYLIQKGGALLAGHDAASVELSRNVSFIEQALFYTDDLKKEAISVDGKDGCCSILIRS